MDNEPYRLHLDSKATMYIQPNTYNPDTFVTLVDIGRLMVVQLLLRATTSWWMTKGPTCLWAAGRSKSGEHPGDWSNKTVFIGRSYNMRYKFSRFLIKSENDTGWQTEDTDVYSSVELG
ncbi:tail fiber protein / tail tubular protein A [Enterobacter phage 02_vB_Eclo_IJM]|nr:tail fiber protein / tail tubular protein A [Enterobacter phage 02_vB_Eclo_IJM]